MVARDFGHVQRMFDRIAGRYDVMNRLMTLGLDLWWRQVTVRAARPRGARALDLGCGTGDLTAEFLRQGARLVVGVDGARRMLLGAQCKLAGRAELGLIQGDVLRLPLPDATFDVVASAFVLRNLADLEAGYREMRRVLRPGGRVLALEICRPPLGAWGRVLEFHFQRVVPALGAAVARAPRAYQYLPASLEDLPSPARMAALLVNAGFAGVAWWRLPPGNVSVHLGRAGH